MKVTELAKQIFTNNHVRASEGNTDSVGKPGGVALAQRKPIRLSTCTGASTEAGAQVATCCLTGGAHPPQPLIERLPSNGGEV